MNTLKKIMHNVKWNLMRLYYVKYIKPNSSILDVGAGELYISRLMSKELKCTVVGADIVDYGTEFVEKVVMDKPNRLRFRNSSFDYVTFNDCLHHMPRNIQRNILEEARRVSKKGILVWEDEKNIISFVLEVLTNRPSMIKSFTHKTDVEWRYFLWGLGFKVNLVHVRRPFWYPLKHFFIFLPSERNRNYRVGQMFADSMGNKVD